MKLTFTVLGVAAPQGSMRAFVGKSTGRAFMTSDNRKTLPWRQDVTAQALDARDRLGADRTKFPTASAVVMRATFYLPRPKGHYGKKGLKASAPKYPARLPDLDKLTRAVSDALTGIAYEDDARIVDSFNSKRYADDRAPCAVFEVETLEEVAGAA